MINIIARKPCSGNRVDEWIVVDRGEGPECRYVSATASPHSLKGGEWFWGHYFITREEAFKHFNERS